MGVLCVQGARCFLTLLSYLNAPGHTGDLDFPHPWSLEAALASLLQRGGLSWRVVKYK